MLARPYWLHLAAFLVLSLLAVPVALLLPLPLKIVVDSALGSQPLPGPIAAVIPGWLGNSSTDALVIALALLVSVTLVEQLQSLANYLLSTYLGEKLVLIFRTHLFSSVQRLSLSYHDAQGSADSLYRIQYDAIAIQWIMVEGIIPYVVSMTMLASMIVVTALVDVQLAIVALSILPALYVILQYYRPRLRAQWRNAKNLESSALSVVQEVLGAVRVVKAFGQEGREQSRFVRQSGDSLSARLRLAVAEGSMGLWVGLVLGLGTALVLFIGVRHVQQGTLSLGALLLVMGYLTQIYGPMRTVSGKIGKLQSFLASADRAFALLDERPDVEERADAIPLGRAQGSLQFRNVAFGYGKDPSILHELTFDVPSGARVGIVGRTGAGKTTIANLLMRLYDPRDGQILLDGVDIRNYRVADLRNQYSIVLQEPVLFSSSIAENIAYARPGASQEEIEAAAKAANAHDFITRLPAGYDTLVGERGMRLSGGERQRISIARAFLKNAPLLILDEPTSSVDVNTEAEIMEAMQRLMSGRTTFMITHRPSTLAFCDHVLEVEDGRASMRVRGDDLENVVTAGSA